VAVRAEEDRRDHKGDGVADGEAEEGVPMLTAGRVDLSHQVPRYHPSLARPREDEGVGVEPDEPACVAAELELLDGYADALVLRQHLSPGTGREEQQSAENGDREVETHGSLLAAD